MRYSLLDEIFDQWCCDLFNDYVKPVLIFCAGVFIGIIIVGAIA